MLRVLVTDDHRIFLKGLRVVLKSQNQIELHEAYSGKETLDLLKENRYDALVLDIDMPEMSGLKVLDISKRLYPKLPVLMLSFYPENDEIVLESFKLGADGYLNKSVIPSQFIEALEKIIHGRKYFTGASSELLTSKIGPREQALTHKNLSDREYQVFMKIIEGKDLLQISKEMEINQSTVSTYKQRVMEKTGFVSSFDMFRYAVKHRMIEI